MNPGPLVALLTGEPPLQHPFVLSFDFTRSLWLGKLLGVFAFASVPPIVVPPAPASPMGPSIFGVNSTAEVPVAHVHGWH